MSADRVWFSKLLVLVRGIMVLTSNCSIVTGASTGFGRRLAELVLKNGEKVVATARRPSALDDLVPQYPSDQLLVEGFQFPGCNIAIY